MELLFFDREDDSRPARVIRIDPLNRTYHYWHIFVPGVQPGQIYGYRAQGPNDRGQMHTISGQANGRKSSPVLCRTHRARHGLRLIVP
jgi:pullulanase/glycogen debranching enzyme